MLNLEVREFAGQPLDRTQDWLALWTKAVGTRLDLPLNKTETENALGRFFQPFRELRRWAETP